MQPLMADGGRDGTPIIVIDQLGSEVGQDVIICSDGKSVTEAMGTKTSPVRYIVLGQADSVNTKST